MDYTKKRVFSVKLYFYIGMTVLHLSKFNKTNRNTKHQFKTKRNSVLTRNVLMIKIMYQ